MSAPMVHPLLKRTLAAVYRFYDAFLFPVSDATPPIEIPLDVSIPSLNWTALRAERDSTYRFSSLTLTRPAPVFASAPVEVSAADGEYVNFEPITLGLPLALSTPPRASDFLIIRPLWPAVRFRPPGGETVVRGQIRSAAALPVAGLKVEMWRGSSPTPPAGTPYTRSNSSGEFLFRFPLLKGRAGVAEPFRIRLENGLISVSPASPSLVLGVSQTMLFQRL